MIIGIKDFLIIEVAKKICWNYNFINDHYNYFFVKQVGFQAFPFVELWWSRDWNSLGINDMFENRFPVITLVLCSLGKFLTHCIGDHWETQHLKLNLRQAAENIYNMVYVNWSTC